MAPTPADWSTYIYLPYGMSVLALGLMMFVAARSPAPVLPRRSLWALAGFGLAHGAHEWLEFIAVLEAGSGHWTRTALLAFDPPLLAISFALLMQAGVEALAGPGHLGRWARIVPAALLAAWAAAAAILPPHPSWPELAGWSTQAGTLSRYLLGFPGALLTAASLFAAARAPVQVEGSRVHHYLNASAVSLACYSVVSGLLAPPPQMLGPWAVGAGELFGELRVAVLSLRALSALAVGGLLAEACLVQGTRLLAAAERLREEFVSVVAHDLRGPLSTISLTAQRLERLPLEQHATGGERKLQTTIVESTRRLSRMIDDLLDASRLEAKRLELRKQRVKLPELLAGVVERAAGLTRGHRVQVQAPSDAPEVEADPQRLEQVLGNLLSNAAKHSFEGADIQVGLEVFPGEVTIAVTNLGPGITADELPQLFSRFYKGRGAREGRVEGLGLGLYICRGLVDAHGGRIWAESDPGRSTTFRFTLPVPGKP